MPWATPVLPALLSDAMSEPHRRLQLAHTCTLPLESCLERPLDVFAYHITFDVDSRPGRFVTNGGESCGMRNNGDLETIRTAGNHGKTDAVDCDRTFRDD